MHSIYFAIGSIEFENYVINEIKTDYCCIGRTSYTSALEDYIKKAKNNELETPDIFIIKINLQQMDNKKCFNIIQDIKIQLNSRVILLSQDIKENFDFHKNVIAFGVYDLILKESFSVDEIIECILKPKNIADNQRFLIKNFQDTEIFNENSLNKNKKSKENKKFDFFKSIKIGTINLKKSKKDVIKSSSELINKKQINYENSNKTYDSNEIYDKSDLNKDIPTIGITQFEHTNNLSETKLYEHTKNIIKEESTEIKNSDKFINPKNKNAISFISLLEGTGCTTTALNTAINLSFKNKKVLFIEADMEWSCINSVYGFSYCDSIGIDSLVQNIENNHYEEAVKAIVTNKWLKEMLDKKFVKEIPNIDFISFSKKYTSNNSFMKDDNLLLGFLTFITLRTDYDYLVFDIGKNFNSTFSKQILGYSKSVFTVITQSTNSILKYIEMIEHKMLDFKSKNNIIINKYVDETLIQKENILLNDYLNLFTIANYEKEMINYEAKGIPLASSKKHKINQELSLITNILI